MQPQGPGGWKAQVNCKGHGCLSSDAERDKGRESCECGHWSWVGLIDDCRPLQHSELSEAGPKIQQEKQEK